MRNKIQGFQHFFLNLLDKKPVVLILSVLLALIIWFTIVVNVYPSTPLEFNNIPLKVDLSGTNAAANGLSLVDCNVENVNVKLTGDRSQIGRLTADDLIAYAEVGTTSTAGEYTLNINVTADNGITFNVDSISPAQATIRLDKIETRTFDVTPSYPNIKVTSGHAKDDDDVTCDPSTIDITGPSAQLNEIKEVVVYTDRKQEIDSSYSVYTNEVRLYTDNHALLDTDSLEIPKIDFQINIPVLTVKELQLTYDILGAPTKFDTDWLKDRLQLSEENITLAAQTSSAFSDLESWYMGYIRLSDIKLEYSSTFDIDLGGEYINRSGIEQVTVTLDNEGLVERDFSIGQENISIVNAPTSYEFELVTKKMSITVIGTEEELDELTPDDIVVIVDLQNYNAEQASDFSWTPTISFIDKTKVWASGSYRIAIQRSDNEETTESEDDD